VSPKASSKLKHMMTYLIVLCGRMSWLTTEAW